jgi:hypothetical protein
MAQPKKDELERRSLDSPRESAPGYGGTAEGNVGDQSTPEEQGGGRGAADAAGPTGGAEEEESGKGQAGDEPAQTGSAVGGISNQAQPIPDEASTPGRTSVPGGEQAELPTGEGRMNRDG